ncbi:hypothetical protein chiPu_0012574 [Chiloscyllium punctatum]|uniref:Uncharacterized protein n=1 Tax=Chiloscyllium punctatum TaxID=137246 RepID=A0A401SUM9_CHIPU|nr:hypothetical protein [Chiloscyllium punctatum]
MDIQIYQSRSAPGRGRGRGGNAKPDARPIGNGPGGGAGKLVRSLRSGEGEGRERQDGLWAAGVGASRESARAYRQHDTSLTLSPHLSRIIRRGRTQNYKKETRPDFNVTDLLPVPRHLTGWCWSKAPTVFLSAAAAVAVRLSTPSPEKQRGTRGKGKGVGE